MDGGRCIRGQTTPTPNFLFHNERGRSFKRGRPAVRLVGRQRRHAARRDGNRLGDYDGDGDLDLFVSNPSSRRTTLFRNLGKGLFDRHDVPERRRSGTLPTSASGGVHRLRQRRRSRLGIVNGHVMNSPGHVRQARTRTAEAAAAETGAGADDGRRTSIGIGVRSEKVGRTLVAATSTTTAISIMLVTNNGGNAELLRTKEARERLGLIGWWQPEQSQRRVGARVRLTVGGTTQLREVKAGSS